MDNTARPRLTVFERGGDDGGGCGPLTLRVVRPRHHLVRRELAEAAQREAVRRRARGGEVDEFEASRAANGPEGEESEFNTMAVRPKRDERAPPPGSCSLCSLSWR